MKPTTIINGMLYANSLQNSFLPVSASITGKEVWKVSAPPLPIDWGDPLLVTVSDTKVMVSCRRGLFAIEKKSGGLLWSKECITKAPPSVDATGIRIVNEDGFMQTIDFDGERGKETYLPILDHNFSVLFLRAFQEQLFIVGNRMMSSFDEPEPEGLFLTNYNMTKREIVWHLEQKDLARGYAVLSDGAVCYVATDRDLYKTSTSASSDRDVTACGVHGVRALSMDHSGNVLLLRNDGKNDVLLCQDQKNKKLWEVPIGVFGQWVSPPACSPDGHIFCSIRGGVVCVLNGVVLWNQELPEAENGLFTTVLSDNSVLAAGAAMVHHLSADGNIITAVSVPFLLTCRPAVDTEGKMYIAGRNCVQCLK